MFRRTFKRLIARICLGTLLFMQLAVAAYACPGLLGMAPEQHIARPAGMAEDAAMSHCANQDQDNLNLCRQYFHAGDQSDDTGRLTVSPVVTAALLITVSPAAPSVASGVIVLPAVLQRTTAPPPRVRFGVFRI